jgi:fermentation-respiration switch protein FrsA (DUF1100 family)
MVVASNDVLAPTDITLKAYSKALEPKELHILPGTSHFDGYTGPHFELNAGKQTEFLGRTLCRKSLPSRSAYGIDVSA